MLQIPIHLQIPMNVSKIACSAYMRSTFNSAAPAGGFWTYEGYDATSGAGDFDDTPPNPLFPYNVGDVIPLGDDFQINYRDKTPGFYKVTYNYSGNQDEVVLELLDSDTQCAGADTSQTFSNTDNTAYSLLGLLSSGDCITITSGGQWEDIDGAGAAFNTTTGELTPSNVSTPGEYRFRYYLNTTGYDIFDCEECPSFESTFTANVLAAFGINITSSAASCDHTISVENPDTTISNEAKVLMDTAESRDWPVYQVRKKVTSSCDGEMVNEVVNYVDNHLLYTVLQTNADLNNGGNIETVKLFSTTTGAIDVPVAPFGPNQAAQKGTAGQVTATDLVYDCNNPTRFSNALEIVIKNYLIDTVGLTDGVNFSFEFAAVDALCTNATLKIYMGVYHSPSNQWVGVNRTSSQIVYKTDSGAIDTTSGNTDILVNSSTNLYVESPAPCNGTSKLRWGSEDESVSTIIDTANTDYNVVTLNVSTFTFTNDPNDSNSTESCEGYTLTASPFNCVGTTTYLWDRDGETTASITVSPGTYSVTADCDNPSSSDTKSITV